MEVDSQTPSKRSEIGQWTTVFILLLGITLWIKDGTASAPEKLDLARALLLATTAVGVCAAFRWKTLGFESVVLKFGIGALMMLSGALTLSRPPGYDVVITGIEDYQTWIVLRGMTTALFLAAFFSYSRTRSFLLLLGLCFLAGSLFWTISHAKSSTIDVVHVFRTAANQMHNGINPYGADMPQIYPEGSPLAHKDSLNGKSLSFGFVYPIGALIGGAVGELVFSDYRFFFAFLFLLGLFLIIINPSFKEGLYFIFPVLLFPRIEFIFERGWADGLSSGLSMLTIGTLGLLPYLAVTLFSFFLATKPYFLIFWLCPLIAFLSMDKKRKKAFQSILLGLPIILYFLPALDKPKEYLWSIFFINLKMPPRFDSLSFYPFWDSTWGIICFVLWFAGLTGHLLSLFEKKTLNHLGFLLIWILFGVFLFAKSSFMNYYFNLIYLCSLGLFLLRLNLNLPLKGMKS
jgi:hypothetical protein